MLDIGQFRELIVKSTLNDLLLYSPAAEELLVFTCATESLGGTFIHQVNGPALGIYQMEPEIYSELWQNYLKSNSHLIMKLMASFSVINVPDPSRLIYDLRFATAMARIFYLRVPEPLPDPKDINAIWAYYKKYYNTEKGKATQTDSITNYHFFTRQ